MTAKTPPPVAKDVNPSGEDTLASGKYSNSGSETTAKELMKMFLDEVRDSLHQACTLAKAPDPILPSIVEHLNQAVSRVRMLESVYLRTVHECHQEQQELRNTWEHSKEKTKLEARFEVVVTNHNLELDRAEQSAIETKRVVRDNDDLKAAKKDLETKLEDQKNATIRAGDARDVLVKKNMDLERELARLRVAYPAQQEAARQAQCEKDAALEKVVDLTEQLEA
ncbi:uncharacterized protein Z519_07850 [Cladophialophora bantiana CBS 173.52]|uniref:Uncharacterized protein n=1 Tax=Cladophialophora bantiana (strain ATCC 10958 / CBS 173.52 / CDC B-1940 / NIH 8579) TaxID=1442370 RepID=A0A0D2HM48_CLAB1|nr:uncharacterized protein Z519_07850 [Cladophialophora bantiana CBS 173.52]KIW91880.1 hypothetical protein Z519_07850 [Cladophialophora bantiana CBS 173.52]